MLDHTRTPIFSMKVKDDPSQRSIPIPRYLQDPNSAERYRILTQLDYSQSFPQWEMRLQSFMLFTTEK